MWPVFRSSRGRYALGVTLVLILVALIRVAVAQVRRPPAPTPLQAATRALIEGRYDEIGALTGKLDQQDPNVAALNARAEIARGHYEEAEARLRPVAQRAPVSEAASQLGLLLQMLGRSEATPILTRVAVAAAAPSDAQALARSARALWALERFQDANDTYREASAAAPHDPAINTAWGDLFLEKYANDEALKSYQMALADDPKWEPALLGSARALANDNPPQATAFAQKALEINPSDVRGVPVSRGRSRRRRRPSRGGARSAAESAHRQSVEPRGARAPRGARVCRRQGRRISRRKSRRRSPSLRTTARSTGSRPSSPRTTTDSTRRWS